MADLDTRIALLKEQLVLLEGEQLRRKQAAILEEGLSSGEQVVIVKFVIISPLLKRTVSYYKGALPKLLLQGTSVRDTYGGYFINHERDNGAAQKHCRAWLDKLKQNPYELLPGECVSHTITYEGGD